MKFSLLSVITFAASAVAIEIDVANPQDSNIEGQFVDRKEQTPFNYGVTYTIDNKPDADVVELYNGDEITLTYQFENNEDEDVTIVGVGGSFRDPRNSGIIANLTDAKVGPLVVPSGEHREFKQKIGVNLRADSYLLAPGIYVVQGSALALLGAKTKLAIVDEKPISFFAPQLIALEFLLVATLCVGGYFAWVTFGQEYFKSVAPASKPVSTASSRSATPVSAQATGGKKTVDESWLPAGHVKKTKRKQK